MLHPSIRYRIRYRTGIRYRIRCSTHGCVVRWHLPLQKGPGLQYLHGLFKSNDYAAEDDSFSGEEGDIVDVPCVNASIVGRRSHLSDGEEDEAGVADEDILSDGEKEADNVAAVEAAEERLANGAAALAGRAAVAAAGSSEVVSAAAAVSQA